MTEDENALLNDFIVKYIENVRTGFDQRWQQITPEIYDKYVHECIGGLLSRQATLSIEMAKAPAIWNSHIAPLILRCMIDAHITLSWISNEPVERTEKYVLYGLGQEKLYLEYMKEALREEPNSLDAKNIQEMIRLRESWLNSQMADWATEVNVGSWSGISVRDMAKEIGRESIYKHAYVPFSGPVHNMWQHVGIHNVNQCVNPMHRFHLVPSIDELPILPDFMYRSAKYLSLSFEVFDQKFEIVNEVMLPEDFFLNHPLFSHEEYSE